MDFEKEIVDGFVIEAKEHLNSIEDDFLALEKQQATPDKELVNKVFRAIHTIKGAAGFLGLEKIGELSHIMETLLAMVRSGEMVPDSRLIDLMLEGVDLLNALLDDIEHNADIDISRVVKKLKNILAKEVSAEVKKDLKQEIHLASADGKDTGFSINEFTRKRIAEKSEYLYILEYDLEELRVTRGQTPTMLIKELLDVGEILEGKIETPLKDLSEKVENTPLFYYVLFVAKLEPIDIKKRLALPEHRIRLLIEGQPLQAPVKTDLQTPGYIHINNKKETKTTPPIIAETTTVLTKQSAPGINTGHVETSSVIDTPTLETTPIIKKTPIIEIEKPAPGETLRAVDTATKTDLSTPVAVDIPIKPAETSEPVEPEQLEEKEDKDKKMGTIRIPVQVLDRLMNLVSELVLVRNQQLLRVDNTDAVARSIVQRLDIVTSDLQETVMQTRMQPIGNVFGKYPRIVRELGKKLGKDIEIRISGSEVELDKTILESLADPLTHIVRNSCDHGIELPEERKHLGKNPKGYIAIEAFHEAGHINIEIKDDGKGIDVEAVKRKALEKGLHTHDTLARMNEKEILSLVMLPGFSTAANVSDLSGRGVGMDVVKSAIDKLNGSIVIESRPGKGTAIYLKLPLTLAIIPSLIVMVGNHRFAIPQVNLEELVALYDEDMLTRIECAEDKEIFRLRDRLLPLVRLSEILNDAAPFSHEKRAAVTEHYRKERETQLHAFRSTRDEGRESELTIPRSISFAVLKVGSRHFGLIIDSVLGTEEIVVKPMHPVLRSLKCYSGATVMGDGRVALILDVEGIAGHAGILDGDNEAEEETSSNKNETVALSSLLLFKVGPSERFALPLPLLKRIEHIRADAIEIVGKKEFITVDGVSTLVIRIDQHLNISPCIAREEMFLILPKSTGHPFGILASSLIDIVEIPLEMNVESYMEDGLQGTAIIQDHMTLFIDMQRLIEKEHEHDKNGHAHNVHATDINHTTHVTHVTHVNHVNHVNHDKQDKQKETHDIQNKQ